MDTVLCFDDVECRSGDSGRPIVRDMRLRVCRGDAVFLHMPRADDRCPIADVAEGILLPDSGRVSFLGNEWASVSYRMQCRMRARIGRVFEAGGWISNLSVRENVVLGPMHHTRNSDAEIRSEVDALCASAGLDAVTDRRPDEVSPRDLRKAEWVRAFLGQKDLVLIENPDRDIETEDVSRLAGMAGQALSTGAAVVFISANGWENWGPCTPYAIDDGLFRSAGEDN